MFKLSLLVIFILSVLVYCKNDKYCDSTLCGSGKKHVACGHSGDFHKTCPEDRHLVKLSNADIQLILNTHNNARHKISNGDERGFKPAIRMATMVSHRLLVLAQKILS